jgi:hypothetical protein
MAAQNINGSKTAQHQAEPSDDAKGKVKRCFVISPIGSRDSDTRIRADDVRDFVITPAVEPLGYKVQRADIFPEPGMIMQQVVEAIIDADLVIADLTDLNANVLYELAIRHETGKPVIMIAEESTKVPFDISQSRTIFFDHNQLRSVHTCIEAIRAQALACIRDGYKPDNPIINAKNLSTLRSSGSSSAQQDVSVMILTTLTDLRTSISRIDGRLRDIEAAPGTAEGKYRYLSAAQLSFLSLQRQAQAFGIDLEGLSPEAYQDALSGVSEAVNHLERRLREAVGEPAPRS